MRRILSAALCAIVLTISFCAPSAFAQQTTVGTGMTNVGDSFFEGFNVGLAARGPNWFFTNGGSGGATPQFGGFDPNAGATLGFGFRGPGFNGSLNIGAAQGSTRGMSSTAGSVTVPNGGMGSISDVSLVPFVTGVVPIVGGAVDQSIPHFGMIGPPNNVPRTSLFDERIARLKDGETPRPIYSSSSSTGAAGGSEAGEKQSGAIPSLPDPKDQQAQRLASAQQSSAGQSGGGSIAEIRRKQAAEDAKLSQEIQTLFDQASAAKAAGKTGVAKIYYEQAARKATGERKEEALAAIRALR
jgi:hypothetical protein